MAISNFVNFIGARFNASAVQSYIDSVGNLSDFVGSDQSTGSLTKIAYLIYMMKKEKDAGYDISAHKQIVADVAVAIDPVTEKEAYTSKSSLGINLLQMLVYINASDMDYNLLEEDIVDSWADYVSQNILVKDGNYASAMDMSIINSHVGTLLALDPIMFTYKGSVLSTANSDSSPLVRILLDGATGFAKDGSSSKEYFMANQVVDKVKGLGLTYDETFGRNPLVQGDIRTSKNTLYGIFNSVTPTTSSIIVSEWIKPIMGSLDLLNEFNGNYHATLAGAVEPFNNFKNEATSLSISSLSPSLGEGINAGYTPLFVAISTLFRAGGLDQIKEISELFSIVLPVLSVGKDEGYTPISTLTDYLNIESSNGAWSDTDLINYIKSEIEKFPSLRVAWGAIGGVNVSTMGNISNAYGIINSLMNKVSNAEAAHTADSDGTIFPLEDALSAFGASVDDYNIWTEAYK